MVAVASFIKDFTKTFAYCLPVSMESAQQFETARSIKTALIDVLFESN